ncbi:MAG: hypothetical protein ACLFRF_02320 [Desulfobacterales bacterium]
MHWLLEIAKIVAILAAAGILGNWFLKEVKQAKKMGRPWYTPYFSVPGALILIALLLPFLAWLTRQ